MGINLKEHNGIIWFNGEFISWQNSKIHVVTHGLHYASSVFEGARAYNGKVFKMHEHNERFIRSGQMLDFKIPYTAEELDEITVELLERNNLTNAYVRPVAWCGEGTMGVASHTCEVNVAIAMWEWPSYFKEGVLERGIRLCLADWLRPDPKTAPVHAKAAGLYMTGSITKNMAERKGYDDALMLDWRGHVAECTASNVFLIIDGALHTPIPDCFLNGITRQTAIQIAKDLGYEVIERYIDLEDLDNADEVFVTGTAVEIMPVGEIDKHKFPVGDITKKIRQAYLEMVGA